jgi:DNA replication protein DnaC
MKDLQKISEGLKSLLLPAMRLEFEKVGEKARLEGWSYEEYLLELIQLEIGSRQTKRVERLLRESNLPLTKSLSTFDRSRLPGSVLHQFKVLLLGSFISHKENVLIFGTPGSGKTHLMCGVAQEMIRQGHRAYFRVCTALLQDLLIAKRELRLNRLLKKLSSLDVLVIDEIGYVQQEKEEMELLFTLFAECYEKTSIMLTSNLPFSKWEGIFKDSMIAAAAVDRLVHHSVILELNLPSFRLEEKKRTANPKGRFLGDEDNCQDRACAPEGEILTFTPRSPKSSRVGKEVK